ncbi:hypothetical protein BS47DRAFT_222464 [Hydnum rufescens UP504]|uniref:Uncharacterized protein n=1 Tax=Hydnum rufescens UP504 TaxID=1448309 RepID=A0A9P6B741_9AGAM|nr:hypothetical protein BS47DRAFT_222464 [Hydnum rufescens UP504]
MQWTVVTGDDLVVLVYFSILCAAYNLASGREILDILYPLLLQERSDHSVLLAHCEPSDPGFLITHSFTGFTKGLCHNHYIRVVGSWMQDDRM